ncbi:MAG: M23 family metallopeptidase [Rikenellaceae bacterium]
MRRLITFFAAVFMLQTITIAQTLDYTPKYPFPVLDIKNIYYTANFGELRASHFHAGVDIKTEEVEGKRIISVDDGYVSRISHQSSGYGLALYVTHKDGTTAVYAHLQRFKDEISDYVDGERRRQKLHNINIYPPMNMFPVKKGEVIALSGNTGSSGGPHLHFEVRDAAQRPLNPLLNRMLEAYDNLPPRLTKLHYIQVDTLAGVPHHSAIKSYSLTSSDGKNYSINTPEGAIAIGEKGYFSIEGVDIKNGVSNIFALTKVDGYIDDEHYFSYIMDGFSFERTRYRNGVAHYQLKDKSRYEVIRLAQIEGSTKEHYYRMINSGVIRSTPDSLRHLRITVEDDMGNTSTLKVNLKAEAQNFEATAPPLSEPVYYNRNYSFKGDGLSVYIPKGSLYESDYFTYKKDSASSRPKLSSLSDIYTVMERTTPLHSYITVSIQAEDIPEYLQSKCAIATTTKSGATLYLGGEWKNGAVTAKVRTLGDYFIVTDTAPPVIRSRFKSGANLSGYNYVSFNISDNLSGTRSYNATLDGEWIPLELTGRVLRYNFREEVDGEHHQIVITATDSCDNTTTHTYNFTR